MGRAGCQPMFCVHIRELSLAEIAVMNRDHEQTMNDMEFGIKLYGRVLEVEKERGGSGCHAH